MKTFFKKIFLWGFVLIFVLVIINYLGFFSKTYKTYEAEIGTLKYELDTKGYIISNEDIIGSSSSGKVEYLVNEGQRVEANTPLAKITSADEKEAKKEDKEIEYNDYIVNVKKIRDKINTIQEQIVFFRKEKNIKSENQAKKELENLYPVLNSLGKKNTLFENKVVLDTSKEKDGSTIVYSKGAGIVSLKTSVFDPIMYLKNMYILDYNKIQKKYAVEKKMNISGNEHFIRVSDNSRAYLLLNIDKDKSELFQKDSRIDIVIEGKVLSAALINKLEVGDKILLQYLLINEIEGMFGNKIKDIKIIPVKKEGIIIDKKSIIKRDLKEGVQVLGEDNTIIFKRINRLATVGDKVCVSVDTFNYYNENKELVIINTLKLYDDILKEPKEEYFNE